jgi:anti-sigma-K factor RskA
MTGREGPDFDELIGADLEGEERERLLRVHELLIAAGPPPELPPELEPVEEIAPVVPLRPRPSRRRLAVAAVLAAALAVMAFGLGFFVGDKGNAQAVQPERVIEMTGQDGRASLAILPVDEAGNWPMRMTVQGLPPLANGEEYELWLSRDGKPVKPCGTFVVADEGRTVVALNAPYKLKGFDGWVVTRRGSQETVLETV